MSKQFNYEDRVSTAWSAWMATPEDSYAAFARACDKAFGDLAPRLAPEELEAKIERVLRIYGGTTGFDVSKMRKRLRDEFSTVACGGGVDWKAKCEAAEAEARGAIAASHDSLKRAEAAERERDELRAWKSSMQSHLSPQEAREHRRKIESERDALAARVRELEGKASTLDDMLGLIHALDDANTDDFARREGLHIAALLNHVRDNKKLKALIAELEARNGK